MAQVELPLVVKKRVFYVLLQDEGPQLAIAVPLSAFEAHLDIIQPIANRDPVASVRVLSWLDDPDVLDMLLALLFLFDHLVVFGEAEVLWVFRASGDVEGKRQDLEGIFSLQLEVSLQIVKKSLLVADVEVRLEVIVHLEAM